MKLSFVTRTTAYIGSLSVAAYAQDRILGKLNGDSRMLRASFEQGQTPSNGPSNGRSLSSSNKCGAAVSASADSWAQCDLDVWKPTGDPSMHCFAYGGDGDPCHLNNNNDANHGIHKDPSWCQGDTFYLWDEPDTQHQTYSWAGTTWAEYASTWASQLQTLRQAGTKVTTPLMKADTAWKDITEFFNACGGPCNDPSSDAYIDVIAINAFCGPWNNGDCHVGAEWVVNQLWESQAATQITRPVYIINWSYLQTFNPQDQIVAIDAIDSFFVANSPVERVYWFGALDFGGESGNNYLTTVTADGETLGQKWRAKCDSLHGL
jgi:Glycosyl hydrolase catalytic core